MDLSLTEEQQLLQDSARDFLRQECPTTHVRAMEEDEIGYSPALWKQLADLYLDLARELGAPRAVEVVLDHDPRAQLRRMSESLDYDALRTVARFTTFLAMTEGAPRKRPIGFLR